MSLFHLGGIGLEETHTAIPILGPVVSGVEDTYQHGHQAEPTPVQAFSPACLRISSSYQFLWCLVETHHKCGCGVIPSMTLISMACS